MRYMICIIMLFAGSCNGQESKRKEYFLSSLDKEIKSQNMDSLIIDITRLTNFNWDTLFIFRPYISGKEINSELGYKWSDETESSVVESESYTLFIFTKNGSVVEDIFVPRRISKDFGFLDQIRFEKESAKFLSIKGKYVIEHYNN